MAWLIGVDEAGYGPNLGPLAVAASVWRIPDDLPVEEVDLYALLEGCVCASAGSERIAIADSKQLYKPGGGLPALEHAVHAALNGEPCDTYQRLIEGLQADPNNARLGLPWHDGFDVSLPKDSCAQELAERSARLAEGCAAAGISSPALRARLVFPAEFNDLVDRYGTKGAALSHVTLGLVREVVDASDEWQVASGEDNADRQPQPASCQNRSPASPILCNLDKHGGRNRYSTLIQHHFPEHWVDTVAESRGESRYRWGADESQITFVFRAGGERFLPTALASMTAKYLRELSMIALNQFWTHHVPDLKPTAGYPVDARRFKAEIAEAQQRLGIDDHILWRNR